MDSSYTSLGGFGSGVNGGDIILVNDPKPKPAKKKILIGGGVALAIVVILVVVLAISNIGRIDIDEYISRYASLFVYGNEEHLSMRDNIAFSSLTEGGNDNVYVVPNLYDLTDQKVIDYYTRLQYLLDMIEKGGTTLSDSDERKLYLIDLANESRRLLSYYFVGSALLNSNVSLEYYVQNQGMDGFLSDYGYPFTAVGDDDWLWEAIGGQIVRLVDNRYVIYRDASSAGCIDGEEITYSCMRQNGVQYADLQRDNDNLDIDILESLDLTLDWLIDDCNIFLSIKRGELNDW